MPDPTAMGPGAAALLGVVQGLTEFLPVSSSGHLVLAQSWLGLEQRDDITFEIAVHVATLFAVVFHYRRDLLALIRHWVRGWGCEGGFKHPLWQLTFALLIGTAITGVIGVVGKDTLESLFSQPRLVGVMLLVTALLLASTVFARESGRGSAVSLGQAALIGLIQGLAITPGISRSGSTISVALLLGIVRPEAARFSFLLSIPAILGALVLKAKDFESISVPPSSLAIGFIAAAVVGYAALLLLVGFVNRGKLWWFAPYCAVLGLLAIVLG